jgi:hypothetical protein
MKRLVSIRRRKPIGGVRLERIPNDTITNPPACQFAAKAAGDSGIATPQRADWSSCLLSIGLTT